MTHPSVKAINVNELIALARKEPGKLSFGSGSSSARVGAELFQQKTRTQFNYVPYKANPPAVIDLVSGQIDLMFVDLTTSLRRRPAPMAIATKLIAAWAGGTGAAGRFGLKKEKAPTSGALNPKTASRTGRLENRCCCCLLAERCLLGPRAAGAARLRVAGL